MQGSAHHSLSLIKMSPLVAITFFASRATSLCVRLREIHALGLALTPSPTRARVSTWQTNTSRTCTASSSPTPHQLSSPTWSVLPLFACFLASKKRNSSTTFRKQQQTLGTRDRSSSFVVSTWRVKKTCMMGSRQSCRHGYDCRYVSIHPDLPATCDLLPTKKRIRQAIHLTSKLPKKKSRKRMDGWMSHAARAYVCIGSKSCHVNCSFTWMRET
jgi:hypothetical protein